MSNSPSGSADESSNESHSLTKLPFRIRNVDEINCDGHEINSNESLSVTIKKRKLPSWLEGSSQQTISTEKRSKPNDKENCSTSQNALDTSQNVLDTANVSSSNVNDDQETDNLNVSNSSDSVEKAQQSENDNNLAVVKNEPTERCDDKHPETNNEFETEPGTSKEQSNHTTSKTSNDIGAMISEIVVEIKKETASQNVLTDTTSVASTATVVNQEASSSTGVISTTTVVKQEASSSTDNGRISCRFGIRCYRRNPFHRQQEAHPGDSDYKRPDHPLPPLGTPLCPYGDQCYRRNPDHFKEFSHPPSTDFKQNWKNKQKRLRQQKAKKVVKDQSEDSNDTDNSLKDFIVSDEDDDYEPCSSSGDELDTEETR